MKKIYLFALSFLVAGSAFSAIHITYVYDDISSTPLYYDLDLDGDNDFSFYRDNNYSKNSVECLKSTSYFAADGSNYPKGYVAGAAMGTYHWESGTGVLVGGGGAGLFGNGDKYLMVKFQNTSGNTFYAWFYLTNNGTDVFSYGWEDVPNQTLTPGQVSGINDLTGAVVKPVFDNGFISFVDCSSFDKAVVYTVEGKQLATIENPVDLQRYSVGTGYGLLVVAVYRKEQLLASAKFVTP